MRMRALAALAAAASVCGIVVASATPARAHCDTLNGPVVTAARMALETGDLRRVLIWVQANDEAEVDRAFRETRAVRALGPEARTLADRFFFETVVRLHRAGEGAPYTGLSEGPDEAEPVIAVTDKALADGSVEPLSALLTSALEEEVRRQFGEVLARSHFDPEDVAAGRAYVKSYVEFLHFVERLHEATRAATPDHEPSSPPREAHAH